MLKRLHPSRLFVFNLSRMWKYGIGESVPSAGAGDKVANAFSTDHGAAMDGAATMPGSEKSEGQHLRRMGRRNIG